MNVSAGAAYSLCQVRHPIRCGKSFEYYPASLKPIHEKLEEAVGVPLFDRSKSKIALNETGKAAAVYAGKVLEANREMIEKTVAFDRSRRTIVLGACAALPISLLLPFSRKSIPAWLSLPKSPETIC